MTDLRKHRHRDRFAFRKRCGWCGVQLRLWQTNLCRRCAAVAYGPGSAPCSEGARWNADPDTWRNR